MPRIITGEFRGRKLRTIKGHDLRPTLDRVKESLFNIIATWCHGARVLDLYCGCGSLGLEALSRGASDVVMVDASHKMCRVAMENVEMLHVGDKAQVMNRDATVALREFIGQERIFDLVFADPPYNRGYMSKLSSIMMDSSPISQSGLVVLEHDKRETTQSQIGQLELWKNRTFGDTVISIYQYNERQLDGIGSLTPDQGAES